MAMEIIDVKYRDMFGINPKYERIIFSFQILFVTLRT